MQKNTRGFTLIELSIVLVIIGLIVGGVLVGRDLIATASLRTQISQIERYNTAANTFRTKFNGGLPGDITDPDATAFGFKPRGHYAGEGDGNGIVEGIQADGANYNEGYFQAGGETGSFWVDLSSAHLIDGNFNAARPNASAGYGVDISGIPLFMPEAKIGKGNFVYVYSDKSINYFAISAANYLYGGSTLGSTAGLTVEEAYGIDAKIDDGLPQTGRVIAQYVSGTGVEWAAFGGLLGDGDGTVVGNYGDPPGSVTDASDTTCYDNGSAGGAEVYSTAQNNGQGLNCALSFKFQ